MSDYRVISKDYNDDGEVYFLVDEWEGEFICFGRCKTRRDIMQTYEFEVCEAKRRVRNTQEKIDWVNEKNAEVKADPEKYLKSIAYRVADLTEEQIEHIKNGTYFRVTYGNRKVQLFDGDTLIKEETFRYAL